MIEKGDKGMQVMELITQLEEKVREKNDIIEELKHQILQQHYAVAIAPLVAKPIAFGVGWLGGMANMGLIWYVVHRWL